MAIAMIWKKSHPTVGIEADPGPQPRAYPLFRTTLWFGLLAGCLELGLVMVQRSVNPHVSVKMLRTNQHMVWMVPVADVLIFSAVGFAIALLARFRRGPARWAALRLPVGMAILTLLLTIEGLYSIACIILASGIASRIGPWLERRAEGFGRLVRVSFPAMALGLALWTGLTYERVRLAETRALSVCPPAKPGAPNVMLIVLDTVRATCLSLYGHYRPTTPNLERLARQGAVFTEARSTAPWTSPAHGSMMTGRWPHELSVAPGVPLDGTFPTLAEILGREGYATAGFVGNIHYCNALYGLGRGFARFEDAYENQTVSLFETVWSSGLGRRVIQAFGYPKAFEDGETLVRKTAAMLNRDVLAWLGKRPADRPFFVFLNYYDAHRPYIFHGDTDLRFGLAALPRPEQLKIDNRFIDAVAAKPDPTDPNFQAIEKEALNLYHDSYDSCIAYLDQQVGLLLDEIERRGLLENTLVIVTSDHGEQLGEHGMISHGASVHCEEAHVPLLVIPPSRSSSPRIIHNPVSLRDIPATIAEWVDLGPRNPFPGRSLTQFLSDDPEQPPETSPVLCELQHNIAFPESEKLPPSRGPVSSLVSRDRVYIRRDDGHEELYDRLFDPLETVNIAQFPQSRPDIDWFRKEFNQVRPDLTSPTR